MQQMVTEAKEGGKAMKKKRRRGKRQVTVPASSHNQTTGQVQSSIDAFLFYVLGAP